MKLAVLLIALVLAATATHCSVVVLQASRTIDLSTQLANQEVEFEFTNKGPAAVQKFNVAFDKATVRTVKAFVGDDELVVASAGAHGEYALFEITLPESVQAGAHGEVTVRASFAHVLTPLPAEITQDGTQLVVFTDNHYIPSPYKIQNQETKIKLSSTRVESHSDQPPTSQSGKELTYGPYTDITAWTDSPMRVHSAFSEPTITATTLVKEVEVSHWGNVAVEETYNLLHTGARLKGPFSRLEYQHGRRGNSVEELTQQLPTGAADVYFRDVIGNVSSSHVFTNDEGEVKFEYKPRYVMFGGWKTEFYMGFNLPAGDYLGTDISDATRHVLTIPFSDLHDMIVDEQEIRVILPEGASNIQFEGDFEHSEPEITKRFTYLDTTGRPVVTVRTTGNPSGGATVTYTFGRLACFWEGILLVGSYFTLLVLVMVFMRIDISISKSKTA